MSEKGEDNGISRCSKFPMSLFGNLLCTRPWLSQSHAHYVQMNENLTLKEISF